MVFFDDYYDDVYLSVRVNGTWTSSSVDDKGGYYTSSGERAISLAIDSDDGLHVAYYDMYREVPRVRTQRTRRISMDQDQRPRPGQPLHRDIGLHRRRQRRQAAYRLPRQDQWDLEYARFDGSEWMVETLDEYGLTGRYPSIALDDSDQVHIAYENYSNSRLMSMVIADGLAATEKVAQVGTHGYGMGSRSGASGGMHLSFYNGSGSSGSLQYATKSGSSWTSATVDESSTMTGILRHSTRRQRKPAHLIRGLDERAAALRVSQWGIMGALHRGPQRQRSWVHLDSRGRRWEPRIAYHDGTLRLAEWDGVSWTLTTQDPGSTGQGTQIAVNEEGRRGSPTSTRTLTTCPSQSPGTNPLRSWATRSPTPLVR